MKHPNIKTLEGKSPILVSAPHAAPIRKTVNGKTYVRMAESRVDEIVHHLNSKKDAWGIYTVSEGPLDGWQERVYRKYKHTIKNLVQQNGIGLVLDIHSAKHERPFFIDYDFILPDKHEHDAQLEKILNQTFECYFPKKKLSTGFYRKLHGSGYKTLTYYVRKYLHMPALQLEINKKLKEDDKNFAKILGMLNDFLAEYEDTIIRV